MDSTLEEEILSHIQISKDDRFINPHSVPVSSPVRAFLTSLVVCMSAFTRKQKNQTVVSVLMNAKSRERVVPNLIFSPEG